MCEPTTIALVAMGVSTAMAAGSSVMQGQAQAKAHKAQAEQYEIERKDAATSTSQAARDRYREFSELEASNYAAAAMSGMSLDSFGATFRGNRATAAEDVSRIYSQGDIEDTRLDSAARQERAAAKSAKRAGIIGALTEVASGVAEMGMNMPGDFFGGGGDTFKAVAGTGGPRRGGKRGPGSLVNL